MTLTPLVTTTGHPTRSLIALPDNGSSLSRFLVGTVKSPHSELLLIHYDDSLDSPLDVISLESHFPGPIWQIVTTAKENQVAMIYGENRNIMLFDMEQRQQVSVWNDISAVVHLATFEDGLLSCQKSGSLCLLNQQKQQSLCLLSDTNLPLHKAKCDPHHANIITALSKETLLAIDQRQSKVAWTRPESHCGLVQDFDHNPNRPHILVTGGRDAWIRVWDTRQLKEPLYADRYHRHWLSTVQYNPWHDQLLLTASSDTNPCLYGLGSFSSAAVKPVPVDSEESVDTVPLTNTLPGGVGDQLLATFDHHVDSVYSACWSSVDPWHWAAVSWDGQVSINQVSKELKYKIIL